MKKIEVKTYNMGESLLNEILFFILGIIIFNNPNGVVKFVIYILGAFSILIGIFKLLVYYQTSQFNPNKKEIINGMIYMLIGMITIICSIVFFDAIETVLRLTVSIFLLYVGINRLINTFKQPKGEKIIYFVNALLIIALSIALAFIQNLPFRIVGLFIIGYSIIEIIGFILCKRKSNTKESIKEATVILEKEINEDKKLLK